MDSFQIVTKLNLHKNSISDKGAKMLAEFLAVDDEITHV
jgi:hypothetical protein